MDTKVSTPDARTLLARSYADDPLIRWIFAGVDEPDHAAAAWLGLFVERYLRAGQIDITAVDGQAVGIAMWRFPDTDTGSATAPTLPTFGSLLAALVGAERAQRIGRSLRSIAALTPEEPHAYLHFLAVDPSRQRGGIGGDLLRRGLAEATGRGLMVHLETASADAVRFYQAHGFTVVGEIVLPSDGPTLWGMRLPLPQ